MKSTAPKKKAFSKFSLDDAYKLLRLKRLTPWTLDVVAIAPSHDFQSHLSRLQRFDLFRSEEGKKLLIDAILLEASQRFEQLKIWKGAALESAHAHGAADYLIAANSDYLESPLLCVIEAKKDDFDQGLAQCLVEMDACQWQNQKIGKKVDIFGIVTNGEGWKFYRLSIAGQVYETVLYAFKDIDEILGILDQLFQWCEQSLDWLDRE